MSVVEAGEILKNNKEKLDVRFRALFMLKNFGGAKSVEYISKCFQDESALLKHELAYCLGQMQDRTAIPILISVLRDESQEPMVRHEAGEALGAIGAVEVLPILEEYEKCEIPEISETCTLAIQRIKWMNSDERKNANELKNPYASVDPTPAENADKTDINELREILINQKLPLFDRYKAMFSLRNINTSESAVALADGLKCGDSALFRHEVAYVLGQMQNPVVIPHLKANLEDKDENCMVRHECAEALGSIADDKCVDILEAYKSDNDIVVKESCEVALDMHAYENSEQFHYSVSNKTNPS